MAAGPGVDMFDSTRIIGEKQFSKGKVCIHTHIHMYNVVGLNPSRKPFSLKRVFLEQVVLSCLIALAPSGPFDVAHTIFKPYTRPRAYTCTTPKSAVYIGQVLPVSMRSLGARL